MGDRYVVIRGQGQDAGRKTTMYKDSGFYKSLPELGRAAHGCANFQNGNGETVCLLLFIFFEN